MKLTKKKQDIHPHNNSINRSVRTNSFRASEKPRRRTRARRGCFRACWEMTFIRNDSTKTLICNLKRERHHVKKNVKHLIASSTTQLKALILKRSRFLRYFLLEPSFQYRFTHSALRRFLSSWLCGGPKMSLLDGPLNVLGQRTTGQSVRTQNGEFMRCLTLQVR